MADETYIDGFTEVEQKDDGFYIQGVFADNALDLDGQRMDKEWLDKAVPAWFEMSRVLDTNFDRVPIGECTMIVPTERGWEGRFIIHNDETRRLIMEDALAGIVVSITNVNLGKDGVIRDGKINAVTLTDKPIPKIKGS